MDENTLVWGHGLADWLPIRNVRTLVCQIRTLEGGPRHRQLALLCTTVSFDVPFPACLCSMGATTATVPAGRNLL